MPSTNRLLRNTLLITAPLLVLAVLIEPLFFARAMHVLAWIPDAERPLQWVDKRGGVIEGGWEQPDFPESKTGATPLVVIESAPMDSQKRARRQTLLHEKLAKAKLGPLVLRIFAMPEASLVQKALHLTQAPATQAPVTNSPTTHSSHVLPTGSCVVLELSILDVIREDRGSWGGYVLPHLREAKDSDPNQRERQSHIQPSWPKDSHDSDAFPPMSLRIPYLRWLAAQPILETNRGSFPSALWPLRRKGVAKETLRYGKLALALRYWKQLIQAREGKLLILYLPLPIEADSRRLAAELMALGLDSKQLQSSRVGKRLRDLCHELAIPYEDTTRLLGSSVRDKSPLYEGIDSLPFRARYSARAEKLILGRMVGQGLTPLFR